MLTRSMIFALITLGVLLAMLYTILSMPSPFG